ncbi:MAG: DTW domain-containing protein [Myxococcales bacterium]|nr:DTW domain-containing protein [Myxococcales bacterium]
MSNGLSGFARASITRASCLAIRAPSITRSLAPGTVARAHLSVAAMDSIDYVSPMLEAAVTKHRVVCGQCRRPESVCYCRHITPVPTATRIVLLQHPRERDMAIGTARMASLCLPNSELHVGLDWRQSPALARALTDPAQPAALLYPGPGAIDVGQHPPSSPVTLVVVDGTWSQTRKLLRTNPALGALPRFAFVPPTPSEYRIRRPPNDAYVSTIEALVHVLGALEGDAARFHSLLTPFRAMVDMQLACILGKHQGRVRHPRSPKPRLLDLPAALARGAHELVCVVGEANAWPYRYPERDRAHPDELIQWSAHRIGTGESFEMVLAPRNPLSPRTANHIQLPEEQLRSGFAMTQLFEEWRGFVRDTDVICSWGHYATGLFADEGGVLPEARLDLRQIARTFLKGKVGTAEELSARIGTVPQSGLGLGRCGMRLAQLVGLVRHFGSLVTQQGE